MWLPGCLVLKCFTSLPSLAPCLLGAWVGSHKAASVMPLVSGCERRPPNWFASVSTRRVRNGHWQLLLKFRRLKVDRKKWEKHSLYEYTAQISVCTNIYLFSYFFSFRGVAVTCQCFLQGLFYLPMQQVSAIFKCVCFGDFLATGVRKLAFLGRRGVLIKGQTTRENIYFKLYVLMKTEK